MRAEMIAVEDHRFISSQLADCLTHLQGVLYCDTGLQRNSDLNTSLGIPSNAAPSLPLYTCRVVDTNTSSGNSTTWLVWSKFVLIFRESAVN